MSNISYEARMDKIFTNGALWQHRTLRTIFDPASTEFGDTDIDEKLKILEIIIDSGEDLRKLIKDYKNRYIEQNRKDIALEVEKALIILLQHKLKKHA